MTKNLHIARGFNLDPDYVGGRTFALLAKKGAGKSYLARVMAEEFWTAKIPFVLLDPMGTSWGLRVAADGKGEGIPVAIFGGEHGDGPLERTGGTLMADLVVDEGLSMVLDMSDLGSRSAERQFAQDFLERLYRRNRDLVHLLLDEADLFAPQKPQAGDRQLLGVTENIVRRGRNRGVGITLITQRPAVLNKDVLTQVDGLVMMQITGLTDRKAVDEWVKGHADPEQAAEVKPTLAGLHSGECWWWIPEQGILRQVKVRESRTFDSSPTQQRGGRQADPKSFADVDMSAIGERMEATIERAKAEDPKELRKTIRELEKQLAKRPTETKEVEVEKVVERSVLSNGAIKELDKALAKADQTVRDSTDIVQAVANAAQGIRDELERVQAADEVRGVGKASRGTGATVSRAATRRSSSRSRAAQQPQPRRSAAPENPASTSDGDFRPTPAQQRILDALAALEVIGVAQANKTQLALFAEASPKSSGYTNNLGALRSAGLIDYPGQRSAALTEAGRAIADDAQAPRSHEELLAFVRRLVGPARSRIIDALVDVYPDALPKDELADRADASATSSGYTNNLGSLRSLGLIDYPEPGYAAATPVLFLEAVV